MTDNNNNNISVRTRMEQPPQQKQLQPPPPDLISSSSCSSGNSNCPSAILTTMSSSLSSCSSYSLGDRMTPRAFDYQHDRAVEYVKGVSSSVSTATTISTSAESSYSGSNEEGDIMVEQRKENVPPSSSSSVAGAAEANDVIEEKKRIVEQRQPYRSTTFIRICDLNLPVDDDGSSKVPCLNLDQVCTTTNNNDASSSSASWAGLDVVLGSSVPAGEGMPSPMANAVSNGLAKRGLDILFDEGTNSNLWSPYDRATSSFDQRLKKAGGMTRLRNGGSYVDVQYEQQSTSGTKADKYGIQVWTGYLQPQQQQQLRQSQPPGGAGVTPFNWYDYPLVKSRGIIAMSALDLVHMLIDSKRVREYNKNSLGRDDLLILSSSGFNNSVAGDDNDCAAPSKPGDDNDGDDLLVAPPSSSSLLDRYDDDDEDSSEEEGSCEGRHRRCDDDNGDTGGILKVTRSYAKPPLLPQPLEFVSLLHARELRPSDNAGKGYIVVSRGVRQVTVVDENEEVQPKGDDAAPASNDDTAALGSSSLTSEVLLNVHLIRPLIMSGNNNNKNKCELINVGHLKSPDVLPSFIAKKVGLNAAVNFIHDIRALC